MAFNAIVVFITFVSLGTVGGIYTNKALDETSGKWYVVAVENYNITLLEAPKCWTIEMSGAVRYYHFTGNTTLYDNDLTRGYLIYFKGIRYGVAGNPLIRKYFFHIIVGIGPHGTLLMNSLMFIHYTEDKTDVRLIMPSPDEKFSYFKKLYISRNPELPSDYNVGNATRVNNQDCPREDEVILPTEDK